MKEQNKDEWEFTTDKLIPINEIIENIEKYGYIDAHLGGMDGFEIDSILYYLKQNKQMKQKKYNLIKYLEDSIKELKKAQRILYENINIKLVEKATVNSSIRSYQDILERLKSGKYE